MVTVIRVKVVREFAGEDVVLLAADKAGCVDVAEALARARQQGSFRLQHRRRVHEFVIESGAARGQSRPIETTAGPHQPTGIGRPATHVARSLQQ